MLRPSLRSVCLSVLVVLCIAIAVLLLHCLPGVTSWTMVQPVSTMPQPVVKCEDRSIPTSFICKDVEMEHSRKLDQVPERYCESPYKGGRPPSADELAEIRQRHTEWLSAHLEGRGEWLFMSARRLDMGGLDSQDPRRANLRGADLRNLNLQGVDLLGADLQEARLGGEFSRHSPRGGRFVLGEPLDG